MFELTHTQKDHLLFLFLQNVQTPLTKAPPPASKFTSNLVKLGTQKSLQKPIEVDNSGPKPLTTNISDKLQNMAPPKFDRGIVTAEEELDTNQQSSPENEMASNNGFDKRSHKYNEWDLDITGSKASAAIKDLSLYPTVEMEDKVQELDQAVHGAGIRTQAHFLALKKGEQVSGHSAGKIPNEDTDKAALHRNILEKLQRLDPSRADHVQDSNNIAVKKFQVLDGSQGNTTPLPLQTELSEAGNYGDAQAKNVLSDFSNFRNGVAAVAVTPIRMVVNWERQARDMTLKGARTSERRP